jgi:hypothetical protein
MCRHLVLLPFILMITVVAVLFWQPCAFSAEDGKAQQGEELYKDILTDFEDQEKDEADDAGDVIITECDIELEKSFFRLPQCLHPPQWLHLSGWLQQRTIYNYAYPEPDPDATDTTDHRGLSSLRVEFAPAAELKLPGDWKARISGRLRYEPIFAVNGSDNYSSLYVEDRETEAELWDAYVEGTLLQGLSVKVGRQIVVWGTSESLRITDVLNPLDYREPGVTDIENMRLPLAMTRLDYTWRRLTLSGIAIHEFRSSKLPVWGSDFYFADEPLPPTHKPDDSLENTEYALSLTARLTGWDVSLYYADTFNDEPYLIMARGPLMVQTQTDDTVVLPPAYENWYSRIKMYGAATTVALKSWLFKSEVAYFQGNRYFNTPNVEKDQLNALVGVEYSGFKDTSITVEYAIQHIFDHEEEMENFPDMVEEDENQAALRIMRDFRHDTVHLLATVVAMNDNGDDGWLARLQAEYDWTDNFSVTLGGVVYGAAADGRFADFEDNDRVFALIRYSY